MHRKRPTTVRVGQVLSVLWLKTTAAVISVDIDTCLVLCMHAREENAL
jgi:hypothetical protein